MTVITKTLGEKTSDNLKEPLVENIVVQPNDEDKKIDVEAGGYPLPPQQTRSYIISARVRPYYSLMFILMLVLLLATSLLGIFGTEYLYEQYRTFVGEEEKPVVYRAWGTLSLEGDPSTMEYESKIPARFEKIDADSNTFMSEYEDTLKKFREQVAAIFNENKLFQDKEENEEVAEVDLKQDKVETPVRSELKEKFELGLDGNKYEKIDIPSKGNSRLVHDFYSNYTAIVDLGSKRCFVMPLDRTVVVPPKSLYDLLSKMTDGYYSMDTDKIRRDMRVVMPPIEDLSLLGKIIQTECQRFTTYGLEKFVSGVVKRDIENVQTFTVFSGKHVVLYQIEGIPPSQSV